MQRLAQDPQTGIDLNPAIVVHTFTATQARSVFFRVFAGVTGGTLAGGGDYLVWIDVQLGGSGAWHRSHPITTAAVAAGVVSIYLQTGAIAVSAGDVVRVYLQGLVADVAVNVTTEVWDDCLPNVAPGASGGLPLSVDAGGGVNAAKIGGQTPAAATLDQSLAGHAAVGTVGGALATMTKLETLVEEVV